MNQTALGIDPNVDFHAIGGVAMRQPDRNGQIKENPYLQFFIDLEGYQYSAPFDPSMMVYFRKRLPESVGLPRRRAHAPCSDFSPFPSASSSES